jgi:hypothetical protein
VGDAVRIAWMVAGGFVGFLVGEVAGLMIGGIGPCSVSNWAFLGLVTGPICAVAYPAWKHHLRKRRPLEWGDGRAGE